MNPLLPIAMAAAAVLAAKDPPPDPWRFAFGLYTELAAAQTDPAASVLVSPYSVRQAAGMAYLGSRGSTREAMARALGAGPAEAFAAEEKAARLSLLAADPSVQLAIANGMFIKKGWPFRREFVSAARESFGAEVFERDLGRATVNELNDWVKKNTMGKILAILQHLEPADRAILLNAIYFKGSWTRKFEKALTRPRDFRPDAGAPFKHPFMAQEGKYAYAETAKWQAVRLPYGKSGRLGMIVVLPAAGSSLADLRKALAGGEWRSLRSVMRQRRGRVELPRFKFEAGASLNAALSALGMGETFDQQRADFRGMSAAPSHGERLYISKVTHKAVIEVNEEGTEAAASTAIGVKLTGISRPETPFQLVADRPFFFAIEDGQSGALLFLGEQRAPKT